MFQKSSLGLDLGSPLSAVVTPFPAGRIKQRRIKQTRPACAFTGCQQLFILQSMNEEFLFYTSI
jgi:hypothetical protein